MSKRQPRRVRPSLEVLETRQLLTGLVHPGYLVTSNGDSGAGTLRDAIEYFNAYRAELKKDHLDDMVPDHVSFHIGKGGHQTIHLHSPLPDVSDYLIIDGTTQPGYAGKPLIELDGSGAGKDANGLHFTTTGNKVVGLVINHFAHAGIKLNAMDTVLQGNYLGTDYTGTKAAGNDVGVEIDFVGGDLIGGPLPAMRNIISGNTTAGVVISTGVHDLVQGNYIGTDVTGTKAVPNGTGVVVNLGSLYNEIGKGNLISGNKGDGVDISRSAVNQVAGNKIGTDVTGTKALKNGKDGVAIFDGAHDNSVGLDPPALAGTHSTMGAPNLISGNGGDGVAIYRRAYRNYVDGNLIGTDVSGAKALGNASNGVHIYLGAFRNLIGGPVPPAKNVISGNGSNGVAITAEAVAGSFFHAPWGNLVQGNFIGTNATGTLALGNKGDGVFVYLGDDMFTTTPDGNYIGAPPVTVAGVSLPAAPNVISGNGGNGVELTGKAIAGAIVPKVILVSKGGVMVPVTIFVSVGVYLVPQNTVVQNNFIGTDATGTKALGNAKAGVAISNAYNFIGETYFIIGGGPPGSGNLISGNKGDGILMSGKGAHDNNVDGNWIGTKVDHTTALGNAHHGVHLTAGAWGNLIGNTIGLHMPVGLGNTIAYNGSATVPGDGVFVESGSGNLITANSIFFNSKLGIELGADGNGGPKTAVVTLTSVTESDSLLVIEGKMHGKPSSDYWVELFANPGPDPSGHSQGKVFLGTAYVTTGSDGNATFTATSKEPSFLLLPPGGLKGFFTATATDRDYNTSEFSDGFAPLKAGT
jgi:titin